MPAATTPIRPITRAAPSPTRSSPPRRSTVAPGSTTSPSAARMAASSACPARAAWPMSPTCTANYVIYVTRHAPLSLVAEVDIVSCGRGYVTDAEREARGYRPGVVRLITDLCVFELDRQSRQLVVVEIFPGVSRDRIAEATGFPVRFSPDCREIRAGAGRNARHPPRAHRSARPPPARIRRLAPARRAARRDRRRRPRPRRPAGRTLRYKERKAG